MLMMQQQFQKLQSCQQQQQLFVLRPNAGRVPAANIVLLPSAVPSAAAARQLRSRQRGAAQITCSLIRRGDDVHTGTAQGSQAAALGQIKAQQQRDRCRRVLRPDVCLGPLLLQSQSCQSPSPGTPSGWACQAKAAWQKTQCSC
jgi:hypothetical protein